MRGPGATCHAGRGGDPRGPHVPAAAGSNGWAGVGCRVCRGRPPRTPRSGGRRFERVGWGLVVMLAAGATPADPTFRRPPVRTGGVGVGCRVCRRGRLRRTPRSGGRRFERVGRGWLSCLPRATPADPTFRRPPVRTGGPGVGCRVCRRGRLRRTPRSGGRRFERVGRGWLACLPRGGRRRTP